MVRGLTCAKRVDLDGGLDEGDLSSLVATVVSLQVDVSALRHEIGELRSRVELPVAPAGSATIKQIKTAVCARFGFTEKQLVKRSRTSRLVRARHIAAYLCCKLTHHPLSIIGDQLGYLDYTSVCHARDKVAARRMKEPGFGEVLANLESRLHLKNQNSVPTKHEQVLCHELSLPSPASPVRVNLPLRCV